MRIALHHLTYLNLHKSVAIFLGINGMTGVAGRKCQDIIIQNRRVLLLCKEGIIVQELFVQLIK